MCKKNSSHTSSDVIMAKTIIIGRTYAAAIERRKNKTKKEINDNFYLNVVAPVFRKSKLDNLLNQLNKYKTINTKNVFEILQAHSYLTDILSSITGQNKRSFSSKYLHFHKPELFFIYDSRVLFSLRNFIKKAPKEFSSIVNSKRIDKEYANFVCKSLQVKEQFEIIAKKKITLRQYDNILIKIANKRNSVK